MPIDVRCPGCKKKFPVTEAGRTGAVQCPFCDEEFDTSLERPDGEPAQLAPTAAEKDKPGKKAEAKPAAKAAAKRPSRSRDDEDDDDDDRGPRRHQGGGGGVLIAAGVAGLLLVLTAFGVVGYLIFSGGDKDKDRDRDSASAKPADTTPANPTTPSGPDLAPRKAADASGKGTGTKKARGNDDDEPAGGPPKVTIPGDAPRLGGGGGNAPPNPAPKRPPVTPAPKPADPTFTLKPEPGTPVKITPPTLGDDPATTVKLPGVVGATAVGGGGRYIVAHIPAARKLAVFDISAAKVVRELPLEFDDPLLTAGMNKAVVVSPARRVLNVYSLPDLQPEGGATPPGMGPGAQPPSGIAMGSATNGPLLLLGNGEVQLFDLKAMKPVEGSLKFGVRAPWSPGITVRASANGRVFTSTTGTVFSGLLTESGGKWVDEHLRFGPAIPSADGETVFGNGEMAGPDGKPLGPKIGGFGKAVWYVPAVHGPYFLRLSEKKEGVGTRAKHALIVTAHAGRDPEKAAAALGELAELDGLVDWLRGQTQPPDRFIFLVPDAKVVAIIPPASKDRVVLRRVELP